MALNRQDSFDDDGFTESSFGLGPPPARRGIKVPWQGGTKVDEENFLKMQEDYLRVMMEFNESEKLRKQLAAKLARAEDAAKKLLAKGDKAVKGNVAARLFELEGQLSQVQDENSQMRHKLARERKANEILRERNKQLDLQARKALADYQRLLRQMKNPKNLSSRTAGSRGSPGRGGQPGTAKSTREAREEEEEMQRRYVDQQEELANLAEENKYLRDRLEDEGVDPDANNVASLNQQISDLRRQLAETQARALLNGPMAAVQNSGGNAVAMGALGSPQRPWTGPAAPLVPNAGWELYELEFDGHMYLLDPATKTVFSRPTSTAQWPHPLGKMTRADPVEVIFRHQQQVGQDFFTRLDTYLKGDRKKLKEVFELFDSDGTGTLERNELGALAQQLVPGLPEIEQCYLQALLDADGDGAISYEELMDAVSDIVHAGHAAKDAHSSEALQVLSRVREAIGTRGHELEDLFAEADRSRHGELSFTELGNLLRGLVPSLSAHELRFLVAMVRQWDVDGNGKTSMKELLHALHIGSWSYGSGPLSPRRSPTRPATVSGGRSTLQQLQTSLTGRQFQTDITRLHTENLELKQHVAILSQQCAEVGILRRDLEESRLQHATAEDRWLRSDPALLARSLGNGEFTAELKDAWNKVKELRQRWLDAKGALDSLRNDYTDVVNKLDEVHKQLNEERKARFRMEKDKEFWRVESTKYKELEPMLDKARLRIAELEKENTQAFSNIFSAPEDAMEELKRLKTELLETRKAKANSEAREASARKELAQLRGYGEAIKPAELHDLRSENQRLERELSRAKVDLDAIMARLAIYDRTAVQDSATPLSLRSPRESDVGGGGDPALQPAPGADVYRELQEIRNVWHEDKNELDKVRKLLEHEEERSLALQAQLEELRSYYEESFREKEKKLADTGRLGQRQTERLEERVRKLEAQLRNAYSQAWKKGGVRSSLAGGSVAMDLDEELAGLAPDENIFEVHLAGAALDEGVLGKNPPTFLSMDFFEHETQATAVVSSVTPEYDHTVQYVLKADTFFVEYLDTKMVVVELNRSKGWDFETVGMARIPLQQVLDDFRLGIGVGRNRQYHYTDIIGPGGRYLGRLRWAAGILKPIDKVLREYRQATDAKRANEARRSIADEHPVSQAIKRAVQEPNNASSLRIVVKGCRGLKPNVPPAESTPYVGYTFPGSELTHFSPFGKGINPIFDDEMVLPIVRTRELERFLSRAELEFEVFDDADRSTGDSSIIGIATLELQELSDGLPIEGTVRLYSAQGRQHRGDIEVLLHWFNPLVVAQPPGAGDRGTHPERSRSREAQRLPGESPATLSATRGSYRALETKDKNLRQLADHGRTHPEDPDELQSVDGQSETSDVRLEGEELLVPSQQRAMERPRQQQEAAAAESPKPAKAQSRQNLELPHRSLSTRIGSPREASGRTPGSTRGASRLSMQQSGGFGDGTLNAPRTKRYDEVEQSMEDIPILRDLSNRLNDTWDDLAENHIIINVECVRLGAEVFHDPRVNSVFVMYEFLPDFIRAEEQVTFTHPKTARKMDFNFCNSYRCGHTPELHRQARYAIGQMMRSTDDAYIPFCLVSDKEDDDEDYHEFGFAEVNLHTLLNGGDMIHHEVDVHGHSNNEVVATLTLTIIAQKALRGILEDTAP